MRMYLKVIIGICVGILFGLFLGPQSLILPKDTVHVLNPADLDLRITLSETSTKIELPQNVVTDFTIIEEITHEKQNWYKVEWKVTAKHLAASGLRGKDSLEKPGSKKQAYLRASSAPPKSSATGLTIMNWISPLGEIFIRLILMLVVPLVFTTLTVGVASIGNIRSLGKIGGWAILFFMVTTSIAITVGMVLSLLIEPGSYVTTQQANVLAEQFNVIIADLVSKASTAPDLIRTIVEIVPDNPIHSMASKHPNILQIMFFAIMFGIALTLIPEKRSKQVLMLLDKASQIIAMMMHLVMAVAPYGVACLIAQTVGFTGLSILGAIGIYFSVVLLGLIIHGTLLSFIIKYLGKMKVWDFWRTIWPAELIAFGTASSSATLPVTLEVAESNLGIPNKISSFVIPLGSSINMDGTALFLGAAVVFIAQAFGVALPFSTLITAFIAILLASVGTAAVPSAGIISLALILSTIGIPPLGIALVIGFDRILDMFRTPINVASDLSVALTIARMSGEEVSILPPEQDAQNHERGFEHRLDDIVQHPINTKDSDQLKNEV